MSASVVRILDSKGAPVGAGLVCAPRGYILTCYHVAADALDPARVRTIAPGERVRVSSPRGQEWHARAELVACSPLAEHDLALLRVDPAALHPALVSLPISDIQVARGVPVRMYGFPRGYEEGVWAFGTLQGAVAWRRLQLDARDIGPGFSGAPVEDLQLGRVIGLVSLSDPSRGSAFVISAAEIEACCPEVAVVRPGHTYEQLTEGWVGLPGDPLAGVEEFLRTYLGKPDNLVPFGGRDTELGLLDTWLHSGTHPCALIAAPAGRGKSALLVRWAARVAGEGRADVAFVPVSNRFNTTRKATIFMLLGKRLRLLCGGDISQWPRGPEEWIAEISHRLRENRPDAGRPLLIMLDGVDEASDWVAGQDWKIPPYTGLGVKILISARLLAGDTDASGWLERLGMEGRAITADLPALDRDGVQDVLHKMGDPLPMRVGSVNLVDELVRLSQGDPLLIAMYVEALQGKDRKQAFLSAEHLPVIPPGLEGFMDRWMKGQRMQWEARGEDADEMERRAQVLLYALSSAFGPVKDSDLAEIAPPGSALTDGFHLRQVIRIVARFIVGDGRRQGYVFSHPRLRDYFQGMIRDAAERERWQQRFAAYGGRVLTALLEGCVEPAKASQYVVQYYRVHLTACGVSPAEFYRLLSDPWMRAWYAIEGSYDGFLNDVSAAWSVARNEGNRAVEIICVLCHSSTVSQASNVFPELLARALSLALTTPQQALAAVQRMDDGAGQCEALVRIAPMLSPALREHALDLARSIQNPAFRLIAVGQIASLLPRQRQQIVLRETFASVDALGEPARREVLVGLAARLPDRLLPDLLDRAAASSDDRLKLQVLRHAVDRLDRQGLDRALRMARRLEWGRSRTEALILLAPALSRVASPEALPAARLIPRPADRARYLAGLCASTVAPDIAEQAMDLVERLIDERDCTSALEAFAPLVPASLVDRALSLTVGLSSTEQVAAILYALSPRLEPRHLAALQTLPPRMRFREDLAFVRISLGRAAGELPLHDLLEALSNIRNDLKRARTVLDFAPAAPDPSALWSEAVRSVIAALEDTAAPEVLGLLAPHLSGGDLREIHRAVMRTPRNRRVPLLRSLLPHLEAGQTERTLEDFAAIGDEALQARVLAVLAGIADEALHRAILDALRLTREEQVAVAGIAALAPRLTVENLPAVQGVVNGLSAANRAICLVELAVHGRSGLAADAVQALADPQCGPLLWELAPKLAPACGDPEVFHLMDAIRRAAADSVRDGLLAELAKHLSPPFRVLLFAPSGSAEDAVPGYAEALQMAQRIPSGYWQARCYVGLIDRASAAERPALFQRAVELTAATRPEDAAEVVPLLVERVPRPAPRAALAALMELVIGPRSVVPPGPMPALLARLAPTFDEDLQLAAVARAIAPLGPRPRFSTEPPGGWDALIALAPHMTGLRALWRMLSFAAVIPERFRDPQSGWFEHPESGPHLARLITLIAPRLRYLPLARKAARLAAHHMLGAELQAPTLLRLAADAGPLPGTVDALLDAIDHLRDESTKAQMLIESAGVLAGTQALRALAIAEKLQFAQLRSEALHALRPCLPPEAAAVCLDEILRSLETTRVELRSRILVELSGVVPRSRLRRLYELAWTIWDEPLREKTLAALPVYAGEGPILHALAQARLPEPSQRSRPLASLIARVTTELREPVRREALAAARHSSDRDDWVAVLFAAATAPYAEASFFAALIDTLAGFYPVGCAERCLALYNRRGLYEHQRNALLQLAWNSVRQLNIEEERVNGIDGLWPLLRGPDAAQAWAWSWAIPDGPARRRIQDLLPKSEMVPPDRSALYRILKVPNPLRRFDLIRELVDDCGLDLDREHWHKMLAALEQIPDEEARMSRLAWIAARLPGDHTRRAFAVALGISPGRLAEAARATLGAFAPEERRAAIERLLAALGALADENQKARLLADLAPLLPEDVAAAQFPVAAAIEGPAARLRAFSALIPVVAPSERHRFAAAILETGAAAARLDWADIKQAGRVLRETLERPDVESLWRDAMPRLARRGRAAALSQLAILLPAALEGHAPSEASAVGQGVIQVCRWWA